MKFIDTNVLVYLADKHDVDKRETAKTVVADAMRKPEEYLLSTQTLAGFSNVCLRKFNMDEDTIRDYLGFLRALKVVSYTNVLVYLADKHDVDKRETSSLILFFCLRQRPMGARYFCRKT